VLILRIVIELKVARIFIDILIEDPRRRALGIRIWLDQTIRHSPYYAVLLVNIHKGEILQDALLQIRESNRFCCLALFLGL